jgi:hypothetical protein
MRQIKLVTVCAILACCYFANAQAGSEGHAPKNKLAHYQKLAGKQLEKVEQDCRPGDFIGPIAPEHDSFYSSCDGQVLRGKIDTNGYGVLTDAEGNTITVQPNVHGSSKTTL